MSIECEIEELAGYAMGKTEEDVDDMVKMSSVDDELFDAYGVDFDTYLKIVKDLLPFTPLVRTGFHGELCNAFVLAKYNVMIVKQAVKQEINQKDQIT